MRVRELIDRVYERSRKRNTTLNPRPAIRDALMDSYRHYVNQLAAQYPELFTRTYRLPLTGVYTPLPAQVGSVVHVENVSGTTLDSTGIRLVPVGANDIDTSELPGFILDGRRIAITGRVWEGLELLIYHRPDIEDFADEEAEPTLILPAYHDVIWRRAVIELQSADGGEPTQFNIIAASDAEMAMYAAYAANRPQQMWQNQ